MRRKKQGFGWLLVLFLAVSICPAGMMAQADTPGDGPRLTAEAGDNTRAPMAAGATAPSPPTEMSLLDLIQKGGIVGYLIIVLSIVSLGLILDYVLTIRRARILPARDIDHLKEVIENGNYADVADLGDRKASFISRVASAGLKESHLGYPAMVKAMEDAAEALSAGFARKIEHLNVIGNISPMLGLLGTVIGMLRCFNELAHVAGAIEPKQLAGGIFEALVTTCMGLIVAIPALYCYAVFKNRVDEYTGEAALMAEQLVAPFKEE